MKKISKKTWLILLALVVVGIAIWLLTGKKEKPQALIPDGTIYVELPPQGGKVLKYKL